MGLNRAVAAFAWSATSLLCTIAAPANATTCRTDLMERRPITEVAARLLSGADRVGIGVVHDVDKGEIKQQAIEILIAFKGEPGEILISPYQVNRVSRQDGMARHFDSASKKMDVFTLVKDEYGGAYASQTCTVMAIRIAGLSKLVPELVRQSKIRP